MFVSPTGISLYTNIPCLILNRRKVDAMKILKISGMVIIVLLSIAGAKVFTLSRTNLNPSKASSNASAVLSAEISKAESKPNNGGSPSQASTLGSPKPEASSETLKASGSASSTLDLNDSFLSCHADPEYVDTKSGATGKASIYGKNLSVIPTQVLIGKASASNKNQSIELMGIGLDFKPLIIVTGSNKETKITLDLSAFDVADGKYNIVHTETNVVVASFYGKKGIQEIKFNPEKAGGYSIIKDKYTFGAIEVVDNLDSADLEQVRKKYIK
jgi:hypothetical protein